MHRAVPALPSSRIFQHCSPPELQEKPWHEEKERLVWYFLFWNQVALHNPQNPWFNSDWQITSWKIENQGENWATEVALWTQQCVQQDGFSHTNPGHCAGIICYPLIPTFHVSEEINSTPTNKSICCAGLQEPIVRARPNFLIKLAHSFSFNLIKISFWKQAKCFQNLDSSWQVLWETLSTSCVWFCFPIQNWGRQLVKAFKYL